MWDESKKKFYLPSKEQKALKDLHFIVSHLSFSTHFSWDDSREAPSISKPDLGSIFTSSHYFSLSSYT